MNGGGRDVGLFGSESFHFDDVGYTLLLNVGSYNSHTALHPRIQILKMFLCDIFLSL
jgi:hypothetical protein